MWKEWVAYSLKYDLYIVCKVENCIRTFC